MDRSVGSRKVGCRYTPAIVLGDIHPVRYGRYLLLDRINVGGMAEVFRGKTAGVEGFERLVALKRILPNIAADPDFVEMFVEEAKLVVQLQHANIAQVYDLGKAEGTYYIAMEYVSGTDLRSMWDRARGRNRLLPIAMSCYIMQRVCEGLDAAHRKKANDGSDISLVHRDVSPQNILISYEGEVKLIDFGIARAANRVSRTQAGVLKGKFGYMSPEQVRGVDLDNRSDIFACGVVLYELLVGDRLFLGESDFSTLEKVRNVEMVPPTRLNKNLSPHLERIVMKALAKNREDRYRWANEMAEDLQRYLFATNQPFARTDMQRYMQQHFRVEMAEERERVERFKQIPVALPAPPASGAEAKTEAAVGEEVPTQEHEMPGISVVPAPPPPPVNGAAGVAAAPPAATPPSLAAALDRQRQHTSGTAFPAARGAGPRPTYPVVAAPRPTAEPPRAGLPTWAAALIGALTVLLVGVGGMLALQMWGAEAPAAMTVQTTPQKADVFLNDERVANRTPFTLDNLTPATYVLTVRADKHEEVVRAVRLQPGDERVVTIDLARKQGTASLIVRTKPAGFQVWVNGQDTELLTPATVTGLFAGEQMVVLKRADGSMVHRVRMPLVESTAEVVEVDTRRLPALLDVTSEPPGAQVEIAGRRKGTTPATVSGLRPGRVTVRLSKPNCDVVEQRVRLRRATVTPLRVVMTCASARRPIAASGSAKASFTASLVSDIFVDGQRVGRTPFFNLSLPVGKHRLRLVPIHGEAPPYEAEFMLVAGDPPKKVHHHFR